MKKIIVAIGLLLFITSCNNTRKDEQCETITLKEETLPPLQPLKLEKIELSENYTMGLSNCYIYQDSILIVVKNGDPYPLTHMLTLVNMNTDEKIGEYFTRGQGPNELLSTNPRLSRNYLDICCYTTGKLVPFNIDSALIYGNDYKPNIIQHSNNGFGEWGSMDDTLFLTTNSFYFDGYKGCKENAKLPEFYWYSKSGKFTPEYKESDYKKIKYLTSHVYLSTISINKQKNRIVCCYYYQPYIKVFDLEMNLIRKINGPEPDDGEYIPWNDMGILFFNENYGKNYYYYSATCDDDNIFVYNFHAHKFKEPGEELRLEKKNENGQFYRFDWDGNLIGRYSANGKNIIQESYSKETNTLYLWVLEEERCMYKAKLN